MKKLFFFLLLFSLSCCKSSSPKEKHFTSITPMEDVHDRITGIPIQETPISSFGKIYILNDYLIIKDNQNAPNLIYLFDKNTFSYIKSIAPRGRGPREITNIGDICPDEKNRKFYVFDHGKLKLFSYDIDSAIRYPSYTFQEKADLNEFFYPDRCCYINDTLSIVALTEVVNNYEKVNELAGTWNMINGKITVGYENPDIKKKRFSFTASEEQNIYVKCYSRYDLMTICRLDGSLKCNIYGPLWRKDITTICHYNMDVHVCGDKILALYSGADYRSKEFYPSKIRVFDTAGNYIKTLETGYPILYFCYDKDHHRIILYTYDEMQFGYLDLEGII